MNDLESQEVFGECSTWLTGSSYPVNEIVNLNTGSLAHGLMF